MVLKLRKAGQANLKFQVAFLELELSCVILWRRQSVTFACAHMFSYNIYFFAQTQKKRKKRRADGIFLKFSEQIATAN